MKPKSRLIMALAVAADLGFMATAYTWASGQSPREVVPQPALTMRTVVVAVRPLRQGTVLTDGDIEEIYWPADHIPAGAFGSKADLLEFNGKRVVLAARGPYEPILPVDVTGPEG